VERLLGRSCWVPWPARQQLRLRSCRERMEGHDTRRHFFFFLFYTHHTIEI
jgi:hypothetical protein